MLITGFLKSFGNTKIILIVNNDKLRSLVSVILFQATLGVWAKLLLPIFKMRDCLMQKDKLFSAVPVKLLTDVTHKHIKPDIYGR